MNGRVDPTPALGQEHVKFFWDSRVADCLRYKYHFALWERAEHECGKKSVFSEQQQVLFVQCIDDIFRVFWLYEWKGELIA